jgi:hypothetical protein
MRFSYSPAIIQAFKDQIPAAFRHYAPEDRKSWTVAAPYADAAITLLLGYFPDADVEHTGQTWSHATTQPWTGGSDHFAVLHLLPSAPIQVVRAAYRALAKLHHPDVHGDTATMRRLAEAYEALSRRLRA